MKEYTKQYENYYQSVHTQRLWNLDNADYGGYTKEEFAALYRKMLVDYFNSSWITTVRNCWLAYKFRNKNRVTAGELLRSNYDPSIKKASKHKGFTKDASIPYALFPRHVLGMDRTSFAESFVTRHLTPFIFQLFTKEELLSSDPFLHPEDYKFPFEHVTIDFLMPVYQMQERLDLLKIAEDRKMAWEVFMDYLLNYIHCYNDEHGSDVYTLVKRYPFPHYVRDNRYCNGTKNKFNSGKATSMTFREPPPFV